MRLFLALAALCVSATVVVGYPQSQSVDPAYLRQYYAHLAQANRGEEGAPIYESGNQEQQSQAYTAPQIRQYQAAAPQQQYSQPQQYKQAPKQAAPVRRPAYSSSGESNAQRLIREEEEEENDNNASYQFGFDVKDDEFTNYQNRQESRDNGVIKGSYSVVDSDGFIRTVKYTADPKEGFKAEVVREPTDIVVKVPPPRPENEQRQAEHRPQNHQYPAAYKQQQQASRQAQQQQAQYQYE